MTDGIFAISRFMKLRKQMAIVPQEVMLFNGTVAENIAYGKPGVGQEIEHAARLANVEEFTQAFPDGYQTRVGDPGHAAVRRPKAAHGHGRGPVPSDPAILILDEATSSLDSKSESLVLQAMDRLVSDGLPS